MLQGRKSQKTAKMPLTLFFFCTSTVFTSVFALRNGAPRNCCLTINPQKVSVSSIVSYWPQDSGMCPVEAIVFILDNGKSLCSNPDLHWTKKAMRKVDEAAEKVPNHSSGLGSGALQENTETTMLPLTSRWPQVPARVGMSSRKHRAKPSKPQRGRRKRIKIIKKKRKGKNKGKKETQKTTKQPVSNHTSSFTTSSQK